MKFFLEQKCEIHNNVFECPDAIIYYNKKFDEFGVIIHASEGEYILINYCPWCGRKLPDSKRELLLAELEKRGINEPFLHMLENREADESLGSGNSDKQ